MFILIFFMIKQLIYFRDSETNEEGVFFVFLFWVPTIVQKISRVADLKFSGGEPPPSRGFLGDPFQKRQIVYRSKDLETVVYDLFLYPENSLSIVFYVNSKLRGCMLFFQKMGKPKKNVNITHFKNNDTNVRCRWKLCNKLVLYTYYKKHGLFFEIYSQNSAKKNIKVDVFFLNSQ